MISKELNYFFYSDLYRVYNNYDKKLLVKIIFNIDVTPGSRYVFFMRICNELYNNKKSIIRKVLFKIMYRKLLKLQVNYGIQISCASEIGPGFTLPHFGNIVLGEQVTIGKNCTILQGVTIGSNLFKDRFKLAKIGDNVLIGAGAKIIGPIKIGNNVTIGANSVITKDIPDGAVVAGNPAKIISYKDSIVIYNDYMTFEEFYHKNRGV
ncbi:serine acetyltransferase [Clostridium perfringens]|nr:serine acetyltransferase [Clostridium perfringens]